MSRIGMLECWNSGMMGGPRRNRTMEQRNDAVLGTVTVLLPNIPAFHHSIIPRELEIL
jgi:hypothetical protein